MQSTSGMLIPSQRPSGQALISPDGWFVHSMRNPGGTEPGDVADAVANNWVRWGGGALDRLLVIGTGRTYNAGAAPHKNIVFPADGATIPVSDGTVRTVVPASATVSTDYGGVALRVWDTLFALVDWGSSNINVEQLLIVRANTGDITPSLITTSPTQEWLMVCSCRLAGHVMLWNGDSLRRGQELNGSGSIGQQFVQDAANLTASVIRGNMLLTVSQAFGWAGDVVRLGVAGAGTTYGESGAAAFASPVVGTNVINIGGLLSGTVTQFRAPVDADEMYMFGAANTAGLNPVAAIPLLDRLPSGGTSTLYFHRRQCTSPTATKLVPAASGWYRVGADTGIHVGVPSSWVPVAVHGTINQGAFGVQIPLNGALLDRNDLVFNDAYGRAVGAATSVGHFSRPPSVRWTPAGFFQIGAVANGSTRLTAAERGVMVGWDDGTLTHATGKANAAYGRGQPHVNLFVPAVGYAIPVAGMPGATRVVQAVAGTTRRFIPLVRDEVLVYRGVTLGSASQASGWMVVPVGTALLPVSDTLFVASSRGTSDGGSDLAPVLFTGGIIIAPGLYKGTTTPTYGDEADSHNAWMPATLPNTTPPGGASAMPVTAGVTRPAAGDAPEFIVMYNEQTSRKTCRVKGGISLSANLAANAAVMFLPGVWARGTAVRFEVIVLGSGSGIAKPRTVVCQTQNSSIGGMNGLLLLINGANVVTNPGLAAGDGTWGVPQQLVFNAEIDVY